MHQIWAIDPDSTPGVYVLLPNAKLIPPSAPAAIIHLWPEKEM